MSKHFARRTSKALFSVGVALFGAAMAFVENTDDHKIAVPLIIVACACFLVGGIASEVE